MYATTAAAEALVNRMSAYGVQASGEVVTAEYHDGVSYDNEMTLGQVAKAGGRITRVRILTGNWGGRRFGDISYVHATLPNGTTVPVRIGVDNGIPLYGPRGLKATFIAWAKEEGVFAKGIGLLDEGNWSVLHGS